jgi:hypothetical protein
MASSQYVIIADVSYPIDTVDQIKTAIAALIDAGLAETPIWFGDVDDPDSFKSESQKLLANAS